MRLFHKLRGINDVPMEYSILWVKFIASFPSHYHGNNTSKVKGCWYTLYIPSPSFPYSCEKMYQALSRFSVLQATGSWARAWERGYPVTIVRSQRKHFVLFCSSRLCPYRLDSPLYVFSPCFYEGGKQTGKGRSEGGYRVLSSGLRIAPTWTVYPRLCEPGRPAGTGMWPLHH